MAKRLPDRKTERCVDCDFIELHSYVCQHDDGPSGELDIRKIHPDCPLDDYNLPIPTKDAGPILQKFVEDNEITCNDDFVRVGDGEFHDVIHDLLKLFGYDHLYPRMEDF